MRSAQPVHAAPVAGGADAHGRGRRRRRRAASRTTVAGEATRRKNDCGPAQRQAAQSARSTSSGGGPQPSHDLRGSTSTPSGALDVVLDHPAAHAAAVQRHAHPGARRATSWSQPVGHGVVERLRQRRHLGAHAHERVAPGRRRGAVSPIVRHPCERLPSGERPERSEPERGPQVVHPRRGLPRELLLGAAEVAVGRRLLVDRAAQLEVAGDGRRAAGRRARARRRRSSAGPPPPSRTSRPGARPGGPRRWRRPPAPRTAWRRPRRRRAWPPSAPRRPPSGRPSRGPCPRRRRRRGGPCRRRCRR